MKISLGPSEMAQQVKVPVTVPEDQSADFGPHMCGFSDSTHVLWHVFTYKEIKYSDFLKTFFFLFCFSSSLPHPATPPAP